jgi:hypothetical protein
MCYGYQVKNPHFVLEKSWVTFTYGSQRAANTEMIHLKITTLHSVEKEGRGAENSHKFQSYSANDFLSVSDKYS